MNKSKIYLLSILFVASGLFMTACNDDTTTDDEPVVDTKTEFTTVEVKDDDGNVVETITTIVDRGEGTGTMTFTKDKTWVISGLVFVNEGQTLTIEPGTVIKGKSGQGENASALVIARGAKIMAEGTAADPIIFTAEADKLDGNLPPTARGLWGGIIVLGNAGLNSAPGETAIEGIPTSENSRSLWRKR
jgi:hypothetical protein